MAARVLERLGGLGLGGLGLEGNPWPLTWVRKCYSEGNRR